MMASVNNRRSTTKDLKENKSPNSLSSPSRIKRSKSRKIRHDQKKNAAKDAKRAERQRNLVKKRRKSKGDVLKKRSNRATNGGAKGKKTGKSNARFIYCSEYPVCP